MIHGIKEEKREARNEIACQVEAYLRGGGEIQRVPKGASGYVAELRGGDRKRLVIGLARDLKKNG